MLRSISTTLVSFIDTQTTVLLEEGNVLMIDGGGVIMTKNGPLQF